jgi:RNA polymerase sigma-70 factor (ECF subfamily)
VNEDESADETLIAAIGQKERAALARLYARYASTLMGIAVQILHDKTDAEDLLHDVFLEVWNKADRYDAARGQVRTWLVLLTRSRAIDRVRALAIARRHAMAAPREEASEPGATPDAAVDHTRVRAAVARLDTSQRTVLQLSYFQGLSCREIAERCGTPLGTVKSRLRAAVQSLHAEFKKSQTM